MLTVVIVKIIAVVPVRVRGETSLGPAIASIPSPFVSWALLSFPVRRVLPTHSLAPSLTHSRMTVIPRRPRIGTSFSPLRCRFPAEPKVATPCADAIRSCGEPDDVTATPPFPTPTLPPRENPRSGAGPSPPPPPPCFLPAAADGRAREMTPTTSRALARESLRAEVVAAGPSGVGRPPSPSTTGKDAAPPSGDESAPRESVCEGRRAGRRVSCVPRLGVLRRGGGGRAALPRPLRDRNVYAAAARFPPSPSTSAATHAALPGTGVTAALAAASTRHSWVRRCGRGGTGRRGGGHRAPPAAEALWRPQALESRAPKDSRNQLPATAAAGATASQLLVAPHSSS